MDSNSPKAWYLIEILEETEKGMKIGGELFDGTKFELLVGRHLVDPVKDPVGTKKTGWILVDYHGEGNGRMSITLPHPIIDKGHDISVNPKRINRTYHTIPIKHEPVVVAESEVVDEPVDDSVDFVLDNVKDTKWHGIPRKDVVEMVEPESKPVVKRKPVAKRKSKSVVETKIEESVIEPEELDIVLEVEDPPELMASLTDEDLASLQASMMEEK